MDIQLVHEEDSVRSAESQTPSPGLTENGCWHSASGRFINRVQRFAAVLRGETARVPQWAELSGCNGIFTPTACIVLLWDLSAKLAVPVAKKSYYAYAGMLRDSCPANITA